MKWIVLIALICGIVAYLWVIDKISKKRNSVNHLNDNNSPSCHHKR